jgi:hypothetical protein
LTFLAYLLPPAIYFLVLAFRNRSRHPVIVSASWDFVGVVFALSGLLLLGGPAILQAVHDRWRVSWLLGRTRLLNGLGDNWYFWGTLWLLYFAVIIGGMARMIRNRQNQTSVYNVEPGEFAPALTCVFERLRLPWTHGKAGRILLGDGEAPNSQRTDVEPSEHHMERAWPVALDVECFPVLRNVTLHWRGDYQAIRPAVEEELAATLQHAGAASNPASSWLLGASLFLFVLAASLVVRLILRLLQQPW